jgi:hypothetical protein
LIDLPFPTVDGTWFGVFYFGNFDVGGGGVFGSERVEKGFYECGINAAGTVFDAA